MIPGEERLAAAPTHQENLFEPAAVAVVAGDQEMGGNKHAIFKGPVLVTVCHLHVDVLQAKAVEEDERVIRVRQSRLAECTPLRLNSAGGSVRPEGLLFGMLLVRHVST